MNVVDKKLFLIKESPCTSVVGVPSVLERTGAREYISAGWFSMLGMAGAIPNWPHFAAVDIIIHSIHLKPLPLYNRYGVPRRPHNWTLNCESFQRP